MVEDDIIKELWEIKDRHAAKYDGDLRKMARALRRLQNSSGHTVVRPKRKARPRPSP